MPILFKDVFGFREDYSKGIFYKGRNAFLKDDPLEPPNEFKTKRQLSTKSPLKQKNINKNNVNIVKSNVSKDKFYLDFSRKTVLDKSTERNSGKPKKQIEQNKKSQKSKFIIINKFSSTDQSNWEESNQVGCKIWINNKTGEVVNECPWKDSKISHENLKSLAEDEVAEGTGALVYQPDEVEELFDYLDNHK